MALKDINKCIDEAVDCIVICGDVNRRFCIRQCVKQAVGCAIFGVRNDLLRQVAVLDKELAALKRQPSKKKSKKTIKKRIG